MKKPRKCNACMEKQRVLAVVDAVIHPGMAPTEFHGTGVRTWKPKSSSLYLPTWKPKYLGRTPDQADEHLTVRLSLSNAFSVSLAGLETCMRLAVLGSLS